MCPWNIYVLALRTEFRLHALNKFFVFKIDLVTQIFPQSLRVNACGDKPRIAPNGSLALTSKLR